MVRRPSGAGHSLRQSPIGSASAIVGAAVKTTPVEAGVVDQHPWSTDQNVIDQLSILPTS